MSVRRQWIVIGALAVLAAGGFVAARRVVSAMTPVTVGSPAPDFTATTIDATPVAMHLHDVHGQVVLLNVWATWCLPCRWEMPSIEHLHQKYGTRGLTVLAVSVDAPGSEETIRKYAHDLGLTFRILHDPRRTIERSYPITGYPETFVIARDGTIRKWDIGPQAWDSPTNEALIERLLRE
ncbi:MAG TPA: TlpA disulfide reductase family protein [Gemmatimonadaceae bacterium]|nr:TlpA disulfide reductase family protein [Gemmatimonadaceae bacterium]